MLLIGLLAVHGTAAAPTRSGFDLYDIVSGGLPRDGIPALKDPRFVSAAESDFLRADSRVPGIERNGIAKAYPIAILNWHEVVNDEIGGEAVVVTYCPLCGSGMAYQGTVAGNGLSFGVSGLLHNSDVLFYDRETESLWSQLGSGAITGPLHGQQLTPIAMSQTTWADWTRRHPETLVLSRDTGLRRDYARAPMREKASLPF